MTGQSRKWMILVATIWIQAFTGTNFDFSAYSSDLKSVLGISQVQLNYLAVASDLGKVFGWFSGLALMYLPVWFVMFIAAFLGFFGYGLQWLVIRNVLSLPYFAVFFLCLIAGCSICWFNTVCFVLCIPNFPAHRPLAISLTVSFNGVSAALYTLVANAINPSSDTIYLLLNALFPLVTSFAALIPILHQPPVELLPPDGVRRDSLVFLILNFLALVLGLYLLFLRSVSSDATVARLLLGGATLLLVLPLGIPGIIYARDWFHRTIHQSFHLEGSSFILVDVDDLELHKGLLTCENFENVDGAPDLASWNRSTYAAENAGCCQKMILNKLAILGEDHPAQLLVRRLDFWLYYIAYFCGGTIGLVYSNNLAQIAESLGFSTDTTTLLSVYSSFSFFGRLLSAAPDFIRMKLYFARTGWFAIALVPTPIAFFLLAASSSSAALHIGTASIGFSSGFIFASAVSVTAELFGPNTVGVNHNILITNIPVGSMIYGLLAALVYDSNASRRHQNDMVLCMGKQCYFLTFVLWGSISVLGLASSLLLFLRTRSAYERFKRSRILTLLY